MKKISFVVPCYNSEDYMEKCIDSLLLGKDDIEIIIIDDGSKDNTSKIADNYAKKYNFIKVIHQENGGHGEGINRGIKESTGKYFKVVDSDDWIDQSSYKELLNNIDNIDSDLIVMNYVYTYTDGRKNQSIKFNNIFPTNKECHWKDTKRFKINQYLMLHSLMFKKDVINKANIDLPKHVFYEDNLFVYQVLKYVDTIYYMNLDFYHYFIGREDQSVQEPQMIKRSSHAALISKSVGTLYDLEDINDKRHKNVMKRHASMIISLGAIFSRLGMTDEGEEQVKDIFKTIKVKNLKFYKKLMKPTNMAFWSAMPGKAGRFVVVKLYRVAHKIVKFN